MPWPVVVGNNELGCKKKHSQKAALNGTGKDAL